MYRVLPPVPLEEGARGPELKAAAAPPASVSAGTAAPAAPAPPEAAPTPPPPPQPAPAGAVGSSDGEAAAIRQRVYEEEMAKGSDPRVAEGRAKAAEMRARKGTRSPGGS